MKLCSCKRFLCHCLLYKVGWEIGERGWCALMDHGTTCFRHAVRVYHKNKGEMTALVTYWIFVWNASEKKKKKKTIKLLWCIPIYVAACSF